MSSSQDSELQRAALDEAFEGMRLLSGKDYEGAIAVCTEAIELVPSLPGPYRTRAEAYGRLGMEKESAADLDSLADLQAQWADGEEVYRTDRHAFHVTAMVIGFFGFIALGGVALQITAGEGNVVQGVSVLFVGALTSLLSYLTWRTPTRRTTQLTAPITKKDDYNDYSSRFRFYFGRTKVIVGNSPYDSISVGDWVTVTWWDGVILGFWPRYVKSIVRHAASGAI